MSKADSGLVYDVFRVSLGWCAGARSGKGICAFVLPVRRAQIAEEEILAITACSRPGGSAPRRATSELRLLAEAAERYFDGETVRFDEFPVDLSSGTAFQQRVWSMIGRIPHGQVRTYRWIGVEIGRPEAARAIGGAVGQTRSRCSSRATGSSGPTARSSASRRQAGSASRRKCSNSRRSACAGPEPNGA